MTTDNGNTQGSGWTVTSSSPNTNVDTSGRVIKGYTVSFRTGAGHDGTVFVPESQYQPSIVRTMVRTQAAIVDEIAALSE
jgi:hypothetical protein